MFTLAGLAELTAKDPPFQTMLFPGLTPLSAILKLLQLIGPLLLAVTLGFAVSFVIITMAVFVQPLPGFVAVTVYVPGTVVDVGLGTLISPGPFHIKVLPLLNANSELDVTIQLRLFVLVAVNAGAAVSVFT